MTRREQIRANRKSLARLHVLDCHQLIRSNINSIEKKETITRREQIQPTECPWLACMC